MNKHYDFSKALRGKLYRPADKPRIPVYLDRDVERRLSSTKRRVGDDLSQVVNAILRKELELA